MRKFWIFILIVSVTCLSSQTFGYFEKKVYCKIEDQNVTIFLKNGEGLIKCQTYMDTIYQLALKKYKEISTIRSYIDQGDDVYYRKGILEDKKAEFLQLVNYRTQIRTAITRFESQLFDKYYAILQEPMEKYYADLETQYHALLSQNISSKKSSDTIKLTQIQQQMGNVSHIMKAKNLDDIMAVVSSYIYLKKQIEGR